MFELLFTVTFFTGFMILLRCVCKKYISAGLRYALWLLVALKLLVFPVPAIEGRFSVLGIVPDGRDKSLLTEEISEEELREAEVSWLADEKDADGNPLEAGAQAGEGTTPVGTDTGTTPEYPEIGERGIPNPGHWLRITGYYLQRYIENVLKMPVWLVLTWGAGSAVCAFWLAAYHFRLERYLRKKRIMLSEGERSRCMEGMDSFAAYSVEGLPTPCLLGRCIYIPAGLAEDGELLRFALEHERCHYRHGDHIWGLVRMVCVCLYWYHPLVWLAAYLSRQDCELACDGSVVRQLGREDRKRYGELLLSLVPVKGSPASCLAMTTAMSGNAGSLKERLCRITEEDPRRKRRIILGAGAAVLGIAGICACVTSGFVSLDKQWQKIQIRRQEGSIPVLQESYEIDYRLSEDAVSCGLYMEQYEYGELVSAEVLDCVSLCPEGEQEGRRKKGKAVFSRALEADWTTGAFIKLTASYSIPDDTASDGAGSLFKAFTLDLSEVTAVGNSFSMASAERMEHRFRMNEDIIFFADYYGDGRLSVPPGHVFESDKYMEGTGDILKSDSCVMLVHLIVSDKPVGELESELEELVEEKGNSSARTGRHDTAI